MDQGGLGDILDLEWLFGDPLFALPAERTRLILMLRYGDGIAEHTYPFVSEGELLTLIRFIDSVEIVRDGCGPDMIPPDDLQRVLLDDISRYPASDRAFIRYLTPADRMYCGRPSRLLFELTNGTSSAAVAVAPRCDEYGYCAIDLRDYGWDLPVDVDADGQPDFDDAWQAALEAVGPYAVQMTGPEALELSSQTQTPVPVLPAPALAHAVTNGPLYYALTGASRVLQGLVPNLSERAGALPPDIVRAGILGSNRPDRAVTRHSRSDAGTGAIWTLEELPGTLRQTPVFREFGGAEVMFPLPNGMWAYALSGADATASRELPGCIGGACAIRAQSPVTCMACHHQGLLGVVDQMAPLMTTISPSYDSETLAAAQAQYVSVEALGALIDEDNRREADAHATAGTPQGFTNRIPYDVFSFEKPLSLAAASHELGIGTERLRDVLVARSGDPRIEPLQPLLAERGQVERRVFSAAYETLMCAHEGASNRPAACAP